MQETIAMIQRRMPRIKMTITYVSAQLGRQTRYLHSIHNMCLNPSILEHVYDYILLCSRYFPWQSSFLCDGTVEKAKGYQPCCCSRDAMIHKLLPLTCNITENLPVLFTEKSSNQ